MFTCKCKHYALLLSPRQPVPNDESLFEFLNSPLKQFGQSGGTRKTTSSVSRPEIKSQSQSQSKFHQPPSSPVKLQPLTSVVKVGGGAGVQGEEERKEEGEGRLRSWEQTDEGVHKDEEGMFV